MKDALLSRLFFYQHRMPKAFSRSTMFDATMSYGLYILLYFSLRCHLVVGEALTPPYFNLAEGREIAATATCGVDTEGPELYCKLVGAHGENDDINIIQGQVCDVCDPTRPDKSHPPEYAVDGMETWWQSPPLSRGMKYNEVNLTIHFKQEFHVAYVYIRMGNSPRPELWVLEKSADYGKTYTAWQYFADSKTDCEIYFGRESLQPISRDDSVICTTEYSKVVPLEGGEIPISILKNRPSANHYFNSTVLQEWTRATNVRLRLLRTKNMLGHLMSMAKQDPTVTRRYFYSIKDISIGGRCMCNGHAESCDIQDPLDPNVLLCRCQHNTCGAKCDTCCPGFEQKAWRQSKANHPFSCERCNCFQHSSECIYDPEIDGQQSSLDIHGRYEGGGVCQNCQHNTEGINCNKCKPTFYRPYEKYWNETDVCQPCNCNHFYSTGNCAEGSGQCECKKEFTPPRCDSCSFGYYDYPNCKPCECFLNGTKDLQCNEAENGQCPCLYNFGGKYCKECAAGFYNFPECKYCECNPDGSVSQTCDQITGNCTCKNNFNGKQCNECQNGYYDYPSCNYCNCDVKGTQEGICDKSTGQCICREGYGGERCDSCVTGYYGYPDCKPCNCSKVGSIGNACSAAGKCSCLVNYAGKTCEQCSPGYYKYPDCLACNCDSHGSNGVSCDGDGRCDCHHNFAGARCDGCREGFYNFPACEDCNCHPAGVVAGFAGCGSVPAGELCQCKERVEGRICNKCKPFYWNLNLNNPDGCEECNCNVLGVLGGLTVCDTEDGQCICKSLVMGRNCSDCVDGTYGLVEGNLFGCSDCNCDVGGSISNICDKKTGQCVCQQRVFGRTCKEPLKAHYFPTLYQYQYEVEDGRTPAHTQVRYGHDETIFPEYSWKGYAIFSLLQDKIQQDIYIYKSSFYRMVLRFVNRNYETVIGTIRVTPDDPADIEQEMKVQFRETTTPAFVTVSGVTGNIPTPFVMNPGRWQVSIEVPKNLFLDYFVLLPEEFYLATILSKKVEQPCTVNGKDLCRDYAYPNLTQFDTTYGVGGFVEKGRKIDKLKEYFQDNEHLAMINVGNRVPVLNLAQPNISFNITVNKPGPYVILVKYVMPLDDQRTHKIQADLQTSQQLQQGSILLYACPYTTLCRQIITDYRGSVAVYQINDNRLKVTLHGSNSNVGIHSIVAIPYDEWSLNYIKPKSICIRKDGQCIPSSFRTPPETKKIQFEEAGPESAIQISNKTYMWINPTNNTIDLKGKVPTQGYYSFIVHYYQPNFQDFDLSVLIQNGQFYEATVPIQYVPSIYGGRSVIKQPDGNTKFFLTENFMLTLKQPGAKNVYLDYLLVVPYDFYNEKYLEEENVDRAGEFISTCGHNHFNIDTSVEGFCRDSVFTITAGHNNGALPCECNYDGSSKFECDKFGGQCHCKPNIIGRRCEACKTGYFGFPDCKPCNCPSIAYCHPDTGLCICPAHVVGEKCDQCEPLTYGFDPLIGCEECKCNALGVQNSLQCDLFNGSCSCKINIVGRQCDVCEAGHYSFPYCEDCQCDTRGTLENICDQTTAECFCKKNVIGPACEICQEGTFNLQESNEEGCTECFCFGKTSRCISSKLVKISLIEMDGWKLVSVNLSSELSVIPLNLTLHNVEKDTVGIDFTAADLKNVTVYFAAPPYYLGKKLSTYGGFLNYTIFYTIGNGGSAVTDPDVILQGAKTYLVYRSFEQPPPSVELSTRVQFVENNFELPTGLTAKRTHLMEVLGDLRGIYIRGTYWTASVTTSLLNVFQEDAISYQFIDEKNGPISFANTVEECHCPPNYQGFSCEECAPGYYRIDSGPHGGYCVPCQCHGHAIDCDVNTGICLNCTHNTRGDHCELCAVGYHGNALAGTPQDCLICACPLPTASNNFADSCEVSNDGEKISCDCNEGYIGARCHSCAPGFYGRPEQVGDFCKPCQCSGNIDPNDPTSCDTVTGECLRCLNNTFGKACSLCAPGYFGDAINMKDCQSCVCDRMGTDHCDSYTGDCVCKPNVVGEKCDRCALEHYNFQSGQGCLACNCAIASESNQCEESTGQCRCKAGVTGRTCDRCISGYWNYTENGCVSCGCKSEYSIRYGCNALTGQCECLQGVIGDKCDQCPHRWVFVQGIGCHQCDSCTHALLNDTDHLSYLIDPVIIQFDSTKSSYFTKKKLENINQTLGELTVRFEEVNPQQVNLQPLLSLIENLEQDSKSVGRKVNYSLDNSDGLMNYTNELQSKSNDLVDDLLNTEEKAFAVIADISKLSYHLNGDDSPELESALENGQEILDEIKNFNITDQEKEAKQELEKIEDLYSNITDFKVPVDDLKSEVGVIVGDLKHLNDKLDDLFNQTHYSLSRAREAESILEKNGKDRLKKKLQDIGVQGVATIENVELADNLNKNSSESNEKALQKYTDLKQLLDLLQTQNDDFKIILDKNEQETSKVREIRPVVQDHASNLTRRAMELDSLLTETRDISGNAVKAANAYKDIVEAVKNAENAAVTAQNHSSGAVNILRGVGEKTYLANENSSEALYQSRLLDESIPRDLGVALQEAQEKYKITENLHGKNDEKLKDILDLLQHIQSQSLDQAYRNASNKAEHAVKHVDDIDQTADETFKELPKETMEAKELPKYVHDTNQDISQIKKQLTSVEDTLPILINTIDRLPEKQNQINQISNNIEENIKRLIQQIALARDNANQVKIGMKFYRNTSLELRNPPNIEDVSTSTRISGYFRTDQLKVLLFYLGNPVGTNLRRTKSDDYMALIIENGYPILKLDVGNGPEQIINEKYVSDNNWYQFIIDRTGHNAKLTIIEELPGGIEKITQKETTLAGPYSIFNVDRNKTKLFIGSIPAGYNVQDEVNVDVFQGEMEELMIGETPLSLWNFNDGKENNHGAIERNKLVNLQPATGYRFNGNGYVVLNVRSYTIRSRSDIQLSFKTFATEGLLFLAGAGKTFIALELRNGKIIYQYNLGKGTKLWHTSKTYNDGKWHVVQATRDGPKSRFIVDDEIIPDTTPAIGGTSIEPVETVSFGGYPNRHDYRDVTNIKFDGCIDNVVLMSTPLDLQSNFKAYDVTPGCPVKFARMVSFERVNPGYVKRDDLSIPNDLKVSFKFKTKEKDGLIFYATDRLFTSNISLALKNGHLVLISQKIELISKETFNDSEWHVVAVMHNDRDLRIDFDDYGYKVMDSEPPPLHILHGHIYIGGLPIHLKLSPGTIGSDKSFSGCIGDFTLNGNVINFANFTDRHNEILGKCVLDEVIPDDPLGVHQVPVLPPLQTLPPYSTQAPQVEINENIDQNVKIRGDGGLYYGNKKTVSTQPPITIKPAPSSTTTTPEPTTTTLRQYPVPTPPPIAPKPKDSCALPLDPAAEDEDYTGMYRFGMQKASRLEYNQWRGKYKQQFDFSLEFKTDSGDGIIFYVSDNDSHQNYIALYLRNGFLLYTFKTGDQPVVMSTQEKFNDDKWHFVMFSRTDNKGKMVIDDKIVVYGVEAEGNAKILIRSPFYIGGLQPKDYNVVLSNLGLTEPFRGCIRYPKMNSKPLENPSVHGVVPCSSYIETGTFFGSGGGYVKLKDRYRVGEMFNIKMDIKPRLDSGVLIAVHGRKDYLVLEMVRGVMKLTVENGKGPITASYKPKKMFYFCDGQWHNIQAVKSKNVVTLSVDNVFTNPSLGDHHSTSADTGSALFLGGHRLINRVRAVTSRTAFVGCIKNVVINNEPVEIIPSMAVGNITVGSCKTN